MQDVHWSQGSFGYFPTYTLGNVYGALFLEVARNEIADFDGHLRNGTTQPLIDWLDENIYRHGRYFTGHEFVARITGTPEITSDALVRYLTARFG